MLLAYTWICCCLIVAGPANIIGDGELFENNCWLIDILNGTYEFTYCLVEGVYRIFGGRVKQEEEWMLGRGFVGFRVWDDGVVGLSRALGRGRWRGVRPF
jgi:hypothetical protein